MDDPVRLEGRYRLEERLAVGGMGAVYAATDERLSRRVAVKLLKEELTGDPTFVTRFQREAQAVAALSHPNIAQVYDYGTDQAQPYIVMELVNGEDLGRILNRLGPLPPKGAVELATQVCAALGAAHEAGIVHRDVKPANILVDPRGQVKVTDFGIARAMGHTTLTDAGTVLGSAQYVSPEQAAGDPIGPSSDLYSLGVLLYQALTGRPPFTGETPVAIALQHLRDQVPAPSLANPAVPPALDAVVLRATAKQPDERYVSAASMAAALEQALLEPADKTSVLPVPVGPAPTLPTAPTEAVTAAGGGPPESATSGRRGRWAAVTVTALLLLALLVWALLRDDGAQTATDDPGDSPATTAPDRTRTPTTPTTTTRQTPTGPVVPANAVGQDVTELEEQLKSAGFEVEKVDVEAEAERETVVGTIPAPGSPLSPGQKVVLIASKGERGKPFPADYTIPQSLVGGDLEAAEDELKSQGLDVQVVSLPAEQDAGTVVATFPSPGDPLIGSTVVLAVAEGEGEGDGNGGDGDGGGDGGGRNGDGGG